MPQHTTRQPSFTPRAAAQLNPAVEKKLFGYAALASATGVGILALAQPSEAKVIYTATHQIIGPNSTLQLDLNGDGVNDFFFLNRFSGPEQRGTFSTETGAALIVYPVAKTNVIWGKSFDASVLPPGVTVGSKGNFVGNNNLMGGADGVDGGPHYVGAWAPPGGNEKNRFVGLRFVIDGRIHFGWARLNVEVRPARKGGVKAVLTAYAYETEANEPIETGFSKKDQALTQPATLGQLALGAAGLVARRREQEVIA